ncbi:MAG TPA: hemerythrin domain-containing protein [Planctomycetota bacterium]|nr:hemerythrin domain-containing protein [Planctomycetota bacterium]
MKEPTTITDFFQQDHREIDDLYRDALERAREGEPAHALATFDEYDRNLERHIRWEEDLIFPAFEEASGLHGEGPTEVMRAEHREIRVLKQRLRAEIAVLRGRADGSAPLWRTARSLEKILGEHNAKEETVLYLACDQGVPRGKRLGILRRVAGEKAPAPRS